MMMKISKSIPSQICDILVKSNPVEEEIQLLGDFINDSFEDVIVDKLPDIADQINNSKRGNIIHNIIIKKDQCKSLVSILGQYLLFIDNLYQSLSIFIILLLIIIIYAVSDRVRERLVS
ncbi:hypothetical protein ACTFIZ_007974 [Dictyostelium cf. discoideum]